MSDIKAYLLLMGFGAFMLGMAGMYSEYQKTQVTLACYEAAKTNQNVTCEKAEKAK